MRPLVPPDEPPEFDNRVRRRGNDWLTRHPDADASSFPDHWNRMREEVQTAFDGCCAYLGFPISSGQIDHFVAKSADRALAYEWSNYRWGEPRVNLLKTSKPFLDPFTAQAGWVTIDPVTLEYQAGDHLPAAMADVAATTFRVLNDPELLRGRRRILRPFVLPAGEWNIDLLRDFFPLLADAARAFQERYQQFLDETTAAG